MAKLNKDGAAVLPPGWKPESTPMEPFVFLNSLQGEAKVDCVTVWFPATNSKLSTSPTVALTLSGVYVKVPFMPTVMLIWVASTALTGRTAATTVKKRIVNQILVVRKGYDETCSTEL